MDAATTQGLEALSYFKDWSNYLLVTTVAALGWTAKKEVIIDSPLLRRTTMVLFSLSIIAGIFTLALIPLVASSSELANRVSIYDITPKFDLFWTTCEIGWLRIKHVCWWQHVLFVGGIIAFVVANWSSNGKR